MNFSLLIYFLAASVQAQLKGDLSTADLSVPANSGEENENLLGDFESEKLDHRRRRRRKMLPLSTAAPSLKLSGPTEPRITMKPATEILKENYSRVVDPEQKPKLIQNNRRKRRFKPKKPRLPSSLLDLKSSKNKTRIFLEKVPERFSNVLMTRAKVEEDAELVDPDNDIQIQLPSPVSDTFETTNMEKNRVVLLQSGADNATVSLEVESQPKYSMSTTSRTFSEISMESMKISEDRPNHVSDSNEATEMTGRDASVRSSQRKSDEPAVINVGLSIEEVERTAESASSGTEQISMKDISDPALYRFEYRVLADSDVAYDDLDEVGDNSFISLNTISPDGLFHPENAPTYEQLLKVDDDVLLQFDEKFGMRNENQNKYEDNSRPQETTLEGEPRLEDPSDSEKVKMKESGGVPLTKFRTVENYPVPVPRDYPVDINTLALTKTKSLNNRHQNGKSNASSPAIITPEDTTILVSVSNSTSEENELQKIPRTAKLEVSSPPDGPQQQVTKSVYTVTTPASFVFFEQTISPSGASSSSTKLGETNKKFINPRSRARTRGPSKSKVSSKANDIAEPTPSQKKQEKKEIDRNSIIGSSEKENTQSLTNLRIALQSNDVHYFPNREPYYPGAGGTGGGGYRPSHGLLPVIPPSGGTYQPPTHHHHQHHTTTTSINTGYNPSSLPSPPMSTNYQPPQGYQPDIPVYQPEIPIYQPEIPVYQPEIPTVNLPFFEPVNFNKPSHKPTYTKNSLTPFKETLQNVIPPRRYKKKVPPHRHQHHSHHSHHSGPPATNFHFVEEFSPIPPNIKVKRVPSESSGSLDVKGPGRGIVDLLKSEDLTVMAALLEETELFKSIDKEGQFTLFVPTDLAFNDFLQKLGGIKEGVNKLKKNPSELSRIVKNHLVLGLVKSADLADDLVGPSAAGTKLRSNVYQSEDRDWKDVKIITINGANMLKSDISTQSGGGLVHVVDRVLFPPTVGDVVQTLQADPEQRFTTFIKALQATRLDREITDYNTGPWTVFAPTNSAFMNLPMKELEELITNPKKLSKLVLNHLINRTIFSAGMKSHQRLTMANGNRANLFARDDRLKIEGSNVINMDIPASNGVIQVVENIIEMGKSPN